MRTSTHRFVYTPSPCTCLLPACLPPVVQVPDTQLYEIEPFVASMRATPKSGMHNAFKDPERWVGAWLVLSSCCLVGASRCVVDSLHPLPLAGPCDIGVCGRAAGQHRNLPAAGHDLTPYCLAAAPPAPGPAPGPAPPRAGM